MPLFLVGEFYAENGCYSNFCMGGNLKSLCEHVTFAVCVLPD